MIRWTLGLGGGFLVGLTALTSMRAHEVGTADGSGAAVVRLAETLEVEGLPGVAGSLHSGEATTGQGYWTFVAATNGVLPLPAGVTSAVPGAHGTLVVDPVRDTVFWGLENVGWVGFSNALTASWVVEGDPAFARGNLHGADLLARTIGLPLVAVTDNVEGEVYLSDTSFRKAETLGWPGKRPYESEDEFHPTDAAFLDDSTLVVTDGYGAAFFMPLDVKPLAYRGEFFGGKAVSKTPHGVTRDPADGSLLLSARPEGEVKRWRPDDRVWVETLGLPAGSTVCDVDIRGEYALAPCLDGPEQSPGPIYILNLRQRTVVATLRPKVDLGFGDAQHIHDAAWYESMVEGKRQLYVLFTSWNPGGLGAMRLVTPGGELGE